MLRYLPLLLLSCVGFARPTPPTLPFAVLKEGAVVWNVVTVDLHRYNLELLGQQAGDPHTIGELRFHLQKQGRRLLAATNAGIFETIQEPSGLFVENAQVLSPLNLRSGVGNFYLSPNGVFWIDGSGAHVAASNAYQPDAALKLATQSGPLLVEGGHLHPALDPASNNRYTRNAVAVLDPWTIALLETDTGATLYELATFARDRLGSRNVLYLDGNISTLCVEDLPCSGGSWAGLLVVSE